MSDRICPACDTPLPPYTFGRPRVYCDIDCRRTVEGYRRDLEYERRRVAAMEAEARRQPTKELRARYDVYLQKDRRKLQDIEDRIARAKSLVEARP